MLCKDLPPAVIPASLLNSKCNSQLTEPSHVIKGEIPRLVVDVHRVIRRVHVRVHLAREPTSHRISLRGESRGEAQLRVAHIVGPGAWKQLIHAGGDGLDVLGGEVDGPLRQGAIGFGLDEANALCCVAGDERGHVEFHHGANGSTLFLLIRCNGLAAEQSSLFGGVPVELYRPFLGYVSTRGQDPERLEDADRARPIIISSRCGQQREQVVGGVLVGADDGQGLRVVSDLGLEAGDDGGLGKRMREELEADVGVERRFCHDFGDVVVQPLRGLLAGLAAKVAIVVTRQVLQDIVHSGRRDLWEERRDEVLVLQLR